MKIAKRIIEKLNEKITLKDLMTKKRLEGLGIDGNKIYDYGNIIAQFK